MSVQDSTTIPYGIFIVGHAGAGKSTFCAGLQHFVQDILAKKCQVINMDPANDVNLPYNAVYNVCSIASVEDLMDTLSIGPNNAMIMAMDIICQKFEFEFDPNTVYLLDLPGQIELFTIHDALRLLVRNLGKKLYCSTINVMDASLCCRDKYKILSGMLTSLTIALYMETPMIHIFSKIDLLSAGNEISCLKDICEGDMAHYLQFDSKKEQLAIVLSELIDDYGMIRLVPYAVEDIHCIEYIWREIQVTSGMVFGDTGNPETVARSMDPWEVYLEYILEKYHIDDDDDTGSKEINEP